MQIYSSMDQLPDNLACVVTIGKFDGVHVGHQAILEQVRQFSVQENLSSVIVTFDRNPLEILAPERCPAAITTLEHKVQLLGGHRIDYLVVLAFDESRKNQTAENFIQELVEKAGVRHIVVGQDFRFGNDGLGSVKTLDLLQERYGYELTVVEDTTLPVSQSVSPKHRVTASLETDDIYRVSSSKIRQLLADGDVRAAAKMLGRNHFVAGTVVHGAKRGREMGFPTANLPEVPEGLVPADGIYAGWLIDQDIRYKAAISVGDNPTFDDVFHKQVEAFLPEVSLDLYGHDVRIEFVERIRPMLPFESVDALITQMTDDVQQVLAIL